MNRLVCESMEPVGAAEAVTAIGPLRTPAEPACENVWHTAAGWLARLAPANGLPVACVALQLVLLLATAAGFAGYGLRIEWRSAVPVVIIHAMLAVLWLHLHLYPGGAQERMQRDVVLVMWLALTMTTISCPAQYAAVALRRPLIDGWLATADAFMGVHVPTLAAWTAVHPRSSTLLNVCYFSLGPQCLAPILLLGLVYKDRNRLWEYAFHFHTCMFVTILGLALFPAECAFQFYGFQSTINQTGFIWHFQALRAGTFHVLTLGNLEGLVSMPSFHVAGALMVTWAFRAYRRMWVPLAILNTGLIAATVMSGAHYFVDVIASFLLFAVSVVVYRRWAAALLESAPGTATVMSTDHTGGVRGW